MKSEDFISTPAYATSGSVGSDLFSTKKCLLKPIKPTLINCGLCIKIPKGYFGLVSGRSSLALKGVITHTGITDNDYRSFFCVLIINLNFEKYTINIGDITLVKYTKGDFKEVFQFNDLDSIERKGGFGSTGK